MNDVTTATYDVKSPETPLDSGVGRIGEHSPHQLRCLLNGGKYSLVNTPARWQVREDKSFHIPDLLSDKQNPPDMESFSAATEHASHLAKAQALVGDARHLVRMVAEALCESGDRRAMQTEVACNVIEKKLGEAYKGIDKHHRRHTNLFLAYFDLNRKHDERD